MGRSGDRVRTRSDEPRSQPCSSPAQYYGRGRRQGVMTGIGHGIGFGIYAFLAAAGIATALSVHDSTERILKWGGISLLLWLGYNFLKASRAESHSSSDENHGPSDRTGFAQGFAIALLNPKILAWMLALYAPFIEANISTELCLVWVFWE